MISDVIAVLVGILGLALLMIVHETGHLLAARAFGMRVNTFSIGLGPTFFKIEPHQGFFWFSCLSGKIKLRLHKHDPDKHGPTVYQVGMIPLLAYVQIAGMNPFEDYDPEDKGSYLNASLIGRISAIFGGPLANYLFASVFLFFSYYYGGVFVPPDADNTVVNVISSTPAEKAGLQDGDRIVAVAGVEVDSWETMAASISKHPEEPIEIVVDRDGERLSLTVTPEKKEEDGKTRGLIGVIAQGKREAVTMGEAMKLAVTQPPVVVQRLVVGLGKYISGKAEADLGGPVMIVKESAKAAKRSTTEWLLLLGYLSAYLGAFNLIPFPALDGGRLMFLGYELTTRRRPNAKVEAHIHLVGMAMLLGLVAYVTIFNDLLGK